MKELVRSLLQRYYHHRVGHTSASLAYYMLFSFFPFTILIGKIMDVLNIPFSRVFEDLVSIVPSEVLSIAQQNVKTSHSIALITWIAIAVHFFVRNINVFLYSIEQALQVSHKRANVYRYVVSFLLALGIMIAMFVIVLLIFISKNLLVRISDLVPVSNALMFVIHYGRFVIIAILIFLILYMLYFAAAGKCVRRKDLLPGAVAGTCAWLLISMIFSYNVARLGKYSLLYGSLSTVIILLLWLYLSSLIIVLGAEFNGALLELHKK